MNGAIINVTGNWAHFKKPETNNNPLTHDFITKTAMIGLIGAVLGIEREAMRPLFPQLSFDLLYGVQIVESVKKESWAFKLRRAENLYEMRPVQMEFLKNPRFAVAIALQNALQNENSGSIFNNFIASIENFEAKYTPVLGLHNCPADLSLKSKGFFAESNGEFATKGFVTADKHLITENLAQSNDFRIGLERIPTFQDDDFWNKPEFYKRVVYPSENREINVSGDYYKFSDGSNWVLI